MHGTALAVRYAGSSMRRYLFYARAKKCKEGERAVR